jgi:hypothetical protein
MGKYGLEVRLVREQYLLLQFQTTLKIKKKLALTMYKIIAKIAVNSSGVARFNFFVL